MELYELQNAYIVEASKLGDYGSISKIDLGNGYCDAEESGDEIKRSQYWSAIMLRYWYKIFGWMRNSASCRLQPEDFVNWLEHVLWVVFYYRSWRYEYEAVVRDGKFIEWKLDENGNRIPNAHYYKVDPYAFDRTVNYFCSAQRGKEYQYLNKDVHKAHIYSDSIDAALDNVGDVALQKAGAIEEFDRTDGIRSLVQTLIKQNRRIEALIVDGFAYQDSFKEIKQVLDTSVYTQEELEELPFKISSNTYSYSPDRRKLVKHLSTIDENFMLNYFASFYDISESTAEDIYKELKGLNNTKLYNKIEKWKQNMINEPELLSYILSK